jgi:hypothetical protein
MKPAGLNTSVVLVILLVTLGTAHAQTVKTLVNIDGTDGNSPEWMAPLQGFDGRLYGGAVSGGSNTCTLFGSSESCGVVFSTTTSGTVTVLHNFDGTD